MRRMNDLANRFEWCDYETGEIFPWESPAPRPLSARVKHDHAAEELTAAARTLWDFRALLPIAADAQVVSLGEGGTPLIAGPQLGRALGLAPVLMKNEAANPTGSFKDRQLCVAISHAVANGYDTAAVVSSGNVACAAAAYSARAGIRAVCFMHGMAGGWKARQAATYGAEMIAVDSRSAAEVFDLCIAACDEFGWYHASTAGLYEPMNVEGAKTIAYELCIETAGRMPEWIVAPVGGGGLLGGIWRGLLDLRRAGLIDRMPRLAGAQPAGCTPLVQAIENNWSFEESRAHPWPEPYTIAGGIADDILFDGHTALPALRDTQGVAIAVNDEEILDAMALLSRTEGLLIEPSCAAAIAALHHLPDKSPATEVCCVLTGTGIKDLPAWEGRLPDSKAIPCDLGALKERLGEAI